ncbi:MAG: LPS assembly lipoprotein LptE [Candidatus Azobacteroides sp.]|nr:LPS assembly lipoprotein LptE [Candidatus Azobacteroides sp.]
MNHRFFSKVKYLLSTTSKRIFSFAFFTAFIGCALFVCACSFSLSFQGGRLNYDLVKTIVIHEFPNRAPLVYPLFSQMLDQSLRNRFIEQTRLTPVSSNGDIEIEGEITNYEIQGKAVTAAEDTYASMTRLTATVHVKYTNNKEANGNVDQSFSTFREYPSSSSLDEVQNQLVQEIVDELVDLIYNATVANW